DLAAVENAIGVEHLFHPAHQLNLFGAATDGKPGLLLQTDTVLGRNRASEITQRLVDACLDVRALRRSAGAYRDVEVAVSDVAQESDGSVRPFRAHPRGGTAHVLLHVAHRKAHIERVKRLEVPHDVLEILADDPD